MPRFGIRKNFLNAPLDWQLQEGSIQLCLAHRKCPVMTDWMNEWENEWKSHSMLVPLMPQTHQIQNWIHHLSQKAIPPPVFPVSVNITKLETWSPWLSLFLTPHNQSFSKSSLLHSLVPLEQTLSPSYPLCSPGSDCHLRWDSNILTGLSALIPGLDPLPALVKSITDTAAKVVFQNCHCEHVPPIPSMVPYYPEDAVKAPWFSKVWPHLPLLFDPWPLPPPRVDLYSPTTPNSLVSPAHLPLASIHAFAHAIPPCLECPLFPLPSTFPPPWKLLIL